MKKHQRLVGYVFLLTVKGLCAQEKAVINDWDFTSKTWENHYLPSLYTTPDKKVSFLDHHSQQNVEISRDFLNYIQTTSNGFDFYKALKQAVNILEVGCGTGEMLLNCLKIFPDKKMLGVDIASNAIDYANQQVFSSNIHFTTFNCLASSIEESFGHFSIAICSNTLEHFRNPFPLLDAILRGADRCIILVPYKQPVTDGYASEGGEGHVYSFDEHSFAEYHVEDWFTFSTSGWQYSSRGEKPLQLVVLISHK